MTDKGQQEEPLNNSQSSTSTQPPTLKSFTKKNWDAIIDEFEKEEKEDASVDDLFKQIYQSSDEDVRRAMNKSFQESGGTVLSTNWANVAEKKVQPKPPGANDDVKSPYDL